MSAGGTTVQMGMDLGPFHAGIRLATRDLKNFGKTVESSLKGLGSGSGSAFKGLGAGIGQAVSGLGKGLGAASSGFGKGLDSSIKGALRPVSMIGHGFMNVVGMFGEGLSGVLSGVSGLVGSVLAPFKLLTGIAGIAGVAGIGFALKDSVRAAANLETELNVIRRVTGFGNQEMGQMRQTLLNISTDARMAGVELSDALSIAQEAGRLGIGAKFGIQGMETFVKDVLAIKVAISELDPTKVAQDIAQILNVFGKGPEAVRGFASAVTRLANSTTASAADILDISQRMKGSAVLANIPVAEMLAMAAVMREAGIKTAVGGNALHQIISKMLAEYERFAKVAGINKEVFRSMVLANPVQALSTLIASIQQMPDPIKQAQAMKGLGLEGVRTGGAMQSAMSVWGKLPQLVGMANEELLSNKAIDDAVGIKAGELNSAMTLLGNQFEIFKSQIGERLAPIVRAFGEALGILFETVGQSLEANKGGIDSWAKSIAENVKYLGLVWDQWPLFVQIGLATAQEKWAQFLEVFRRSQIIFGNVMEQLGLYLSALMPVLAENMQIGITNALSAVAQQIGQMIESGDFNVTVMNAFSRFGIGLLQKSLEWLNPLSAVFRLMGVDVGGVFDQITGAIGKFQDELADVAVNGPKAFEALPKFSDFFNKDKLMTDPESKEKIDLFGGLPTSDELKMKQLELMAAYENFRNMREAARAQAEGDKPIIDWGPKKPAAPAPRRPMSRREAFNVAIRRQRAAFNRSMRGSRGPMTARAAAAAQRRAKERELAKRLQQQRNLETVDPNKVKIDEKQAEANAILNRIESHLAAIKRDGIAGSMV